MVSSHCQRLTFIQICYYYFCESFLDFCHVVVLAQPNKRDLSVCCLFNQSSFITPLLNMLSKYVIRFSIFEKYTMPLSLHDVLLYGVQKIFSENIHFQISEMIFHSQFDSFHTSLQLATSMIIFVCLPKCSIAPWDDHTVSCIWLINWLPCVFSKW